MDGASFYWCTWVLWIITTFFMKKENKYRFAYSVCLLLAIIISPYQLNVGGFTISWLLLIILGVLFIYAASLRKTAIFSFFICVFLTMLAYCTFQLLAILDPVWMLFNQNWMLAIFLMILARVLYSNPVKQIMLILFGSINGDILFALLLKPYHVFYSIGTLHFFDCLLISITSIITLYIVKEYLAKWEQHIYMMEKEKQKLS
ncbi:YphA family membrane protein [Niallia sp. 01092]|uniref:YphA family membrane protein n=1 Tax=unclassified Niallia TaxID=2837522 RepID=UPI003FD4DC17